MKGIYRDVLRGERGVVYDSGWVSNTIVTRCRVLLAGFMKNETASGIRYLAVGQGDVAWDTDGVPAPDPELSSDLVDRHPDPIPANELTVVYLDDADEVTVGPTSRIQVTATLVPGYPPILPGPNETYPLREFGLFGELDGTDYMINSIRHPVIHKDASASLTRVVRLSF